MKKILLFFIISIIIIGSWCFYFNYRHSVYQIQKKENFRVINNIEKIIENTEKKYPDVKIIYYLHNNEKSFITVFDKKSQIFFYNNEYYISDKQPFITELISWSQQGNVLIVQDIKTNTAINNSNTYLKTNDTTLINHICETNNKRLYPMEDETEIHKPCFQPVTRHPSEI